MSGIPITMSLAEARGYADEPRGVSAEKVHRALDYLFVHGDDLEDRDRRAALLRAIEAARAAVSAASPSLFDHAAEDRLHEVIAHFVLMSRNGYASPDTYVRPLVGRLRAEGYTIMLTSDVDRLKADADRAQVYKEALCEVAELAAQGLHVKAEDE